MVYAYSSAWPNPNSTEAQACQKASIFLPHSDEAIYIGFPWAELFESIDSQSEDAGILLAQLDALKNQLPKGKKLVTVCQHPGLRKHCNFFSDLDITDLFWSHAIFGEKLLPNTNIRLWPFPLYPTPTASANNAYSSSFIKGQFSLCLPDLSCYITHLWECVNRGVIPVITNHTYLPPGNANLWQQATVSITATTDIIDVAHHECESIAKTPEAIKTKIHALNQLKKIYGIDFLISDVVQFFFNPSGFIFPAHGHVDAATHTYSSSSNIIDKHHYLLMNFVSTLMIDKQKAEYLISGDSNYKRILFAALKDSTKDRQNFYNRVFAYYGLSLD